MKKATPKAANIIIIIPIIARMIPPILAMVVAPGGNMLEIAYNITPIMVIIIPVTKLMQYW